MSMFAEEAMLPAALLSLFLSFGVPFAARRASTAAARRIGEPPPGPVPAWAWPVALLSGVAGAFLLATTTVSGTTLLAALALSLFLLAAAAGIISDGAWWYLPDSIVLPLLILAVPASPLPAWAALALVAVLLAAGHFLCLAQLSMTGRLVATPPDIIVLGLPMVMLPIDWFLPLAYLVMALVLAGFLIRPASPPQGLEHVLHPCEKQEDAALECAPARQYAPLGVAALGSLSLVLFLRGMLS